MTDYDRLLPVLLSAWRWATVPEASERDPRYIEVTEGRDTGAVYSSCRDLAHWGLEVIGVRLPWLLRASLGTWAYGRPVVTPGFEAFTGEVEAGDVLVVANDWPRGKDAHVVCVVSVTEGWIGTAEYGQPGGKAKMHPRGKTMGGRKIQVRLSLRKVLATARAAGKLVDPTWPKRSDTEPAPPPDNDIPPEYM